jgi:hypothetical protein
MFDASEINLDKSNGYASLAILLGPKIDLMLEIHTKE